MNKAYVCGGCGKTFYRASKGDRVHKYCSSKCFGKKIQKDYYLECCWCKKMFSVKALMGGGLVRKYCSRACSAKAQAKQVMVKCGTCGEYFTVPPSHIKVGYGKYCSMKCRDKSYEAPIGHEKRNNGHLFVKVRNDLKEMDNYKVKSVVVIEGVIGRKLTKTEWQSIKYIDGDNMNCDISNLTVGISSHVYSCSKCGRGRLMSLSERRLAKTDMCLNCFQAYKKTRDPVKRSKEFCDKMREINGTVEAREKFSRASKARWANPIIRKKIIDGIKKSIKLKNG